MPKSLHQPPAKPRDTCTIPTCFTYQAQHACLQGRSVGDKMNMQHPMSLASNPRHPISAHLVQCISLGLLAKVLIHPRIRFHHPGLYAPFSSALAILALQPSFGSGPIVLSGAERYPRQAPDRPLRYVKPARGLISRQSGGCHLSCISCDRCNVQHCFTNKARRFHKGTGQ